MAFYGLKNLKRINIPRELEKCCVGAFAECLKLKDYEGFELDEAPPEFSPLDAIYCKDSLLEGTLRVPDDVALTLFASTFTPIKGYKRIACIEYKKGQKETKFCPVCGNYKSISMFGKCKICGTKYAAVK